MEARKRFQKLYEYSFYESNMNEDDEDDAPDAGTDPMAGGPEGGADPMAGGPEGDTEGELSDPMAGMEDQMDGNPDGSAIDPMAAGNAPDMTMDPMAGGEDEEVIDVDDLTDAQEKTYDEIGDLSKKFDKLLNVIDKFEEVIQMNDSKIDSLEANIKAELEKRNPTAIEKLNLRSQNDSQPFNVSPNDYWKNKEATSNYRIGDDMEEDAPQYKIYQADIDEVGDWRSISQSLDNDDFKQTLSQILNF